MKNYYFSTICIYSFIISFNLAIAETIESDAFSISHDIQSIRKVTSAVADWQIAHETDRPGSDWAEAALWTGLVAHAEMSGDRKYEEYLKNVSTGIGYQLGKRDGFGDDHCVGQLHLWNYLRDQKPKQLLGTYDIMSGFVDRPHDEDLAWGNRIELREWAWCDALYMSPPTLAALYSATGEKRFIEKMDKLWWKTTDYLYCKKESLFFRDSKYFDMVEENGEKMFWSRGNGWVFAGLCHVMQHMPADYPSRARYVALFKEMASKLQSLQLADGSWRASLLNPASYSAPESSGTAFFAYGFTWGINNGLLSEEKYMPTVIKAWQRLVKNVHQDGKLGYVQPIGENPKSVNFDMTEVYGVGGFLLLGAEMQRYLILKGSNIAVVKAINTSSRVRINQLVSIPWEIIEKKLSNIKPANIAVRDTVRGDFLSTQITYSALSSKPESIIFIADFTPNEKREFQLLLLGDDKPIAAKNNCLARFVPERKDDFAWENNRIAFRTYGPALAKENARGGIDVWTKSTRYPVVNSWYKKGDYHTDNGTGLDGYKVGAGLGCGGLGYIDKLGNLTASPVFESFNIVENGPVRLKFELKYGSVRVGQAEIRENRTITMNSGSHAFKVTSTFTVKGNADGIRPVAGLATRAPKSKPTAFSSSFIGYWDPIMSVDGNGYIGTFILNGKDALNGFVSNDDHLLKILSGDIKQAINYHAGAFWSKSEPLDIKSFNAALYELNHNVLNPICVE